MQMQVFEGAITNLMVMEGIEPVTIHSESLLKACNKDKEHLDENGLEDNINQVAKLVDLLPKQIESLKAK